MSKMFCIVELQSTEKRLILLVLVVNWALFCAFLPPEVKITSIYLEKQPAVVSTNSKKPEQLNEKNDRFKLHEELTLPETVGCSFL